jgi:uncharacterized protein HemY
MEPYKEKKPKKTEITTLSSLHAKKDFIGLEEECRNLLERYENSPEIQNYLGAALSGQGLYQDSFKYFFKAIVDDESSSQNLMTRKMH